MWILDSQEFTEKVLFIDGKCRMGNLVGHSSTSEKIDHNFFELRHGDTALEGLIAEEDHLLPVRHILVARGLNRSAPLVRRSWATHSTMTRTACARMQQSGNQLTSLHLGGEVLHTESYICITAKARHGEIEASK